jgi:hypothetical protein
MQEVEPGEIIVELRLSDPAEQQRLLDWIEGSGGFAAGAAGNQLSVMISDHVPDDAAGEQR